MSVYLGQLQGKLQRGIGIYREELTQRFVVWFGLVWGCVGFFWFCFVCLLIFSS